MVTRSSCRYTVYIFIGCLLYITLLRCLPWHFMTSILNHILAFISSVCLVHFVFTPQTNRIRSRHRPKVCTRVWLTEFTRSQICICRQYSCVRVSLSCLSCCHGLLVCCARVISTLRAVPSFFLPPIKLIQAQSYDCRFIECYPLQVQPCV